MAEASGKKTKAKTGKSASSESKATFEKVYLKPIREIDVPICDLPSHPMSSGIKSHDDTIASLSKCVIDLSSTRKKKDFARNANKIFEMAPYFCNAAINSLYIQNIVDECMLCSVHYMHLAARHIEEKSARQEGAIFSEYIRNEWEDLMFDCDLWNAWDSGFSGHVYLKCACEHMSRDEYMMKLASVIAIFTRSICPDINNPMKYLGKCSNRIHMIFRNVKSIGEEPKKLLCDVYKELGAKTLAHKKDAVLSTAEIVKKDIQNSAESMGALNCRACVTFDVMVRERVMEPWSAAEEVRARWDNFVDVCLKSETYCAGILSMLGILSNNAFMTLFRGMPVNLIYTLASTKYLHERLVKPFNGSCICDVCIMSAVFVAEPVEFIRYVNQIRQKGGSNVCIGLIASQIVHRREKEIRDMIEQEKCDDYSMAYGNKGSQSNSNYPDSKFDEARCVRKCTSGEVSGVISEQMKYLEDYVKIQQSAIDSIKSISADALKNGSSKEVDTPLDILIAICRGVCDYGEIFVCVNNFRKDEKIKMHGFFNLIGIKSILPRNEPRSRELFLQCTLNPGEKDFITMARKDETSLFGTRLEILNGKRFYTVNDMSIKCATDFTTEERLLLMGTGYLPLKPIEWNESVLDNPAPGLVHVKELGLSKICTNCGKDTDKISRCNLCRCVCYCSVECQRDHWENKGHRMRCPVYVECINEIKGLEPTSQTRQEQKDEEVS